MYWGNASLFSFSVDPGCKPENNCASLYQIIFVSRVVEKIHFAFRDHTCNCRRPRYMLGETIALCLSDVPNLYLVKTGFYVEWLFG